MFPWIYNNYSELDFMRSNRKIPKLGMQKDWNGLLTIISFLKPFFSTSGSLTHFAQTYYFTCINRWVLILKFYSGFVWIANLQSLRTTNLVRTLGRGKLQKIGELKKNGIAFIIWLPFLFLPYNGLLYPSSFWWTR